MLPDDDAALLEQAGVSPPEDPAAGLFARDGWLRRVSGDPALVFGGGRALLLEVAHPLVAAGIAEHSDFRRDPYGRLQRTLDAMRALVFQPCAEALAAARSVERAHRSIRGRLVRAAGPFAAGTPYAARDPELMLWIWATLLDTALVVHGRFVGPLSGEALAEYHRDQAVLARVLGVPADLVPGGPEAFRSYMARMLAGDCLAVTEEAREIARSVLETPAGSWGDTVRLLTAGLLPDALRDAFGLPWGEGREAELRALQERVRAARRLAVAAVDGRGEPR